MNWNFTYVEAGTITIEDVAFELTQELPLYVKKPPAIERLENLKIGRRLTAANE